MNKKWFALVLCLLFVFAGAGCSSANKSMNYLAAAEAPMPEPMEDTAYYDEAEIAQMAPSAAGGNSLPVNEEGGYGGYKLIRNANLGLETKQFDDTVAFIKDKVISMGGYVSSSNVSGRKPETYTDSGRYARISVRVPQESMDHFLSDTRAISFATVVDESTGTEDITASYFDTESRLSIYKTQQERTLALLEKAESMEDIIALETELSRLTYEIEALTTQLRRWDDLVSFASVNISISEIPPNVSAAADETMGTRISDGFRRTFNAMGVFFENFVVFLLVASPVLILLGVIALVVVLIVRGSRKRKKKKQEEAQKAMEKPREE